jgi:hypothetical protein
MRGYFSVAISLDLYPQAVIVVHCILNLPWPSLWPAIPFSSSPQGPPRSLDHGTTTTTDLQIGLPGSQGSALIGKHSPSVRAEGGNTSARITRLIPTGSRTRPLTIGTHRFSPGSSGIPGRTTWHLSFNYPCHMAWTTVIPYQLCVRRAISLLTSLSTIWGSAPRGWSHLDLFEQAFLARLSCFLLLSHCVHTWI